MSNDHDDSEITEADILEAISTDPAEFADMVMRVDIMLTLADHFKERKIPDEKVSEILGISVPWVNELFELNIDLFSTEELKDYCDKASVKFESLLEQVRFS
jgi:predicted XRE-type DNA-binding protein